MRTLITNWENLVGKTIESIWEQNKYRDKSIIFFTDNTVVVLGSNSDFDSGYHSNISVITPDNEFLMYAEVITDEEWEKRVKENQMFDAIDQLETLQRYFPHLNITFNLP